MIITAMAGALILASTPPKPAPPPPPPPPRPQGGPHIKTFDGGGSDPLLAKPATPSAPTGGLAPASRPPALLLPAIQMPRDPAPPPRPK